MGRCLNLNHDVSLGECEAATQKCVAMLNFSHSGRTAQDIRIERVLFPATRGTRAIRSCDNCSYTFYCCDKHYESAHHLHSYVPYEDGHEGETQCNMNQEISKDQEFAKLFPDIMSSIGTGPAQTCWQSLDGRTWRGDYMPSLVKYHGAELENDKLYTVLRRDSD
jgi:hypothetical protein